MPLEQPSTGTSLIDVLDRVLDKGIVIDAWVRVSVVGIDLVTIEARVVVASIQTYLQYGDVVTALTPAAPPATRQQDTATFIPIHPDASRLMRRVLRTPQA